MLDKAEIPILFNGEYLDPRRLFSFLEGINPRAAWTVGSFERKRKFFGRSKLVFRACGAIESDRRDIFGNDIEVGTINIERGFMGLTDGERGDRVETGIYEQIALRIDMGLTGRDGAVYNPGLSVVRMTFDYDTKPVISRTDGLRYLPWTNGNGVLTEMFLTDKGRKVLDAQNHKK